METRDPLCLGMVFELYELASYFSFAPVTGHMAVHLETFSQMAHAMARATWVAYAPVHLV